MANPINIFSSALHFFSNFKISNQFRTSDNVKKTSPPLPLELMDMILKNAMDSCSSIEFMQLLIVCMKVNRSFYFGAKKILENPDVCGKFNDYKYFSNILKICLDGIFPVKIADTTRLHYFPLPNSKSCTFTIEEMELASKYIRKKASLEILRGIEGPYEIENILRHGQRMLKFQEETNQQLKITLGSLTFFPDQTIGATSRSDDIEPLPLRLPYA